jgi:uncharacterized protein (TIGR02452 family)
MRTNALQLTARLAVEQSTMTAPATRATRYGSFTERLGHTAEDHRALVWGHTHEIVKAGGYVPEDDPSATNRPVSLRVDDASLNLSLVRGGDPVTAIVQRTTPMRVVVQDTDCLIAAGVLAQQGDRVLVMDAGSRDSFGGHYKYGARAQEEELCRRSTLACQVDCSLGYQRRHLYPLAPQDAIHVPNVTVFRHGATQQYRLMAAPYVCGTGIVAAYCCPEVDSSGQRLVGQPARDTYEMLRSFFVAAAENGYTAVVCVAVGCGAFRNPATYLAELYAKVLRLPEVQNSSLQTAYFAVLDDHNAHHQFNPDGNFLPFARILNRALGASVLAADGSDVTVSIRGGELLTERTRTGDHSMPPAVAEVVTVPRPKFDEDLDDGVGVDVDSLE